MLLSPRSRQHHATPRIMGILANPVVSALVPPSSGFDAAPLHPTPLVVLCEPELRMHEKGNFSATPTTFIGESYWRPRAPNLISLEVASQTPSIIKRGFEYTYHKSHGHRFTGESLHFGPVPSIVPKSQRDSSLHCIIPAYLVSDTIPPLPPVAPISFGSREKHDGVITFDICSDSAKKVIKAAPLISLDEAKQREVTRRNCAARCALEKERESRRLKREVAEVARKKAQAKREEEECVAHPKRNDQEKAFEALEKRKREEGSTLAAAVAAREGGLVVAPTDWIVPLISLDEARYTEKAKRGAVDKSKPPLHLSPPQLSVVASVDSLMVNAGNGNTTTLQLISLHDACERDRARRLEEGAVRSRTRILAQTGTGLNHVQLITLVGARKQDALRQRGGSSQDGDKFNPPASTSKSRKPSRPLLPSPVNRAIETGNGDRFASPRDKAAPPPQEKARGSVLMFNAGNRWIRPNVAPDRSGPATAHTSTGISDWV
ncbi:hypothetical protein BDM02DRAFT_3190774 [Thelephora ganbajun]|uniref:Uncharacterized protein n=1 Tax=Thelephora ganbajun TaxID=370292 RepID=A0ACB6Z4G8_THEGA|nr:hypothetical protein BDM02DRAFT_3190774 [Thelephora ganbajun]